MNIKKALVSARKKDRVIRGKTWPAGIYMYHGMDNIMRHSDGGAVVWSVAMLLAKDYVTTAEAKYHGSHAEPEGIHSPKVDTDKGERKMGLMNPLTQCDGCRRGLPVDEMRIHREADGHPYMVCDSSLYANAESEGNAMDEISKANTSSQENEHSCEGQVKAAVVASPTQLESVLAQIEHMTELGKSKWYEVVYFDEKWRACTGSKTFEDGERVVNWKYTKDCL